MKIKVNMCNVLVKRQAYIYLEKMIYTKKISHMSDL